MNRRIIAIHQQLLMVLMLLSMSVMRRVDNGEDELGGMMA